MIENCPDEMECAHRAGLPGEKMIECDICGKKVMECELTNFPPLDNRLLCDQCVAAFPTWIGEL